MTVLTVTVPGIPQPQGSLRSLGAGRPTVHSNAATLLPWRHAVIAHVRRDDRAAACAPQGQEPHEQPPVEPGDAVRVMSPAAALAGGPGEADGSRTAWGAYEAAVRRWEGVLDRLAPSPTKPGRNGQPCLPPRFANG